MQPERFKKPRRLSTSLPSVELLVKQYLMTVLSHAKIAVVEEMIGQVFYFSCSSFGTGHIAERSILNSSQRNNLAAGITGFLFRTATHYFQVLEGEPSSLKATMKRIRVDDRHRNMKEWPPHSTIDRFFPSWSMGYAIAEQQEVMDAAFRNGVERPTGEVVLRLRNLAKLRFSEDN